MKNFRFSYCFQLVLSIVLLLAAARLAAAYTWKGAVTELNTDYTNTHYWNEGTSGETLFYGTANVSYGNTLSFSNYTFNFGAANTVSTLNVDGTLNITTDRPVMGIGNGSTSTFNVNGLLNVTAVNFCFGEFNDTKTVMNIHSGGSVVMSGLVGSSGQTTVNIASGASLRFASGIILGYRGGNNTYSYQGIIHQTGGTFSAMTTGRQWTNISGIGIGSSAVTTGSKMPSGQLILSGGSMSTVRFGFNNDYDEDRYTYTASTYTNSDRLTIYSNLGLSDTQKALANSKCFLMTDGEANIVSVSNLTASDSASFGSLEVPTLFLGGKLNVLKIDAGRMKDDTFEQYGGVIAPNGGTWANNVLTVDPHGITGTTVTGNFKQYDGAVWLDIASGTSFDQFTVSGSADLAGTIYVTDVSGAATGIQSYNILKAGTLTTQDGFGIVFGGKNVLDSSYSIENGTISTSVTYGDTVTYNWKGGTDSANAFLTRASWTDNNGDAHSNINYQNHIFGDSTNGNAYAKVTSGTLAGSNTLQMAAGTSTAALEIEAGGQYEALDAVTLASAAGSTASLNINGTFLADSTLTSGAGTTNITVGTKGTLNVSGVAGLQNTTLNSSGTLNFAANATLASGTLTVTNGTLTANASNTTTYIGYGAGNTASLVVGTTDQSTSPVLKFNKLYITGQNANASTGNFTLNSGTVTTGELDYAFSSDSKGTFNLNGGTFIVTGQTRFTESQNAVLTFNMTGGTFLMQAQTTWGSHGQTTVNISGGTMTALGQFVLNFYEQSDSVMQTGGTVNLWANSTAGWNVRTNPGYISGYANNNTWNAGLQFGNTWGSDSLRAANGSTTWSISGGTLNAYRIFNMIAPTENMLYISGDAQVNIVSSGAAAKYYGILSAPASMTGGTLNVETIYALAPYYNSKNVMSEQSHNYMLDGIFKQEGGVLSPDGGSVDSNNKFVASAAGISSTTIIGNYTLSGTGAIKLDVGAFDTDFNSANDSVLVVCADGTDGGHAIIGGSGVKINLSSALLTNVQAGNYDADLSAAKVLLMTASDFGSSVVDWYGWNNQLKGTDYYWTSSVESYGAEGLQGLYAVLASASAACYWDQTAGAWSSNVYAAPEFYVGSSTIGNSPNATSAVLNQSSSSLGTMHVAQDAGNTGKLTVTNNAQISSLQLNEVGIAGTGELVIDAGASLTASSVTLGVDSTGVGTLTVNGTAALTNLVQGKGTANIAVGSAGTLSVASTFSQTKGSITSAGTLRFHDDVTLTNADVQITGGTASFNAPLVMNSGTMTLSGNSKTSIVYSENTVSRIGTGSSTATLNVKGNAQLQISAGSNDERYMKFGGSTSTANLNFSENAVVFWGTDPTTRFRGSTTHLGDGGTTNTTLSGNALLFSNNRIYFGEVANASRLNTLNLTENSKFLAGVLLVSGSGNTELNIKDDAYMNIANTFCVGFGGSTGVINPTIQALGRTSYGTTSVINQTGGTAEIWCDTGELRWNSRGLTFGGAGGTLTAGTYNLSGGTLNTYLIWGNGENRTAPLFTMSGGTLNVIDSPNRTDMEGSIEVPFLFTGGTINARTIVGYGSERSLAWSTDHNNGVAANNTFYQFGGTLAPNGGSTQNATLAVGDFGNAAYKTYAAGTEAANTTVVGNYVIDLKDATDVSIPVISLDVFTGGAATTYDTITVQNGDLAIDSKAVLQLVFDDRSAADPFEIYNVISITNGTLSGTFGAISITDLTTNTTELINDPGTLALLMRTGNTGISLSLMVPEPAAWVLFLLGTLGLLGSRVLTRKQNSRSVQV